MAFEASDRYIGTRPGFVFKTGALGLGYYAEEESKVIETWNFGSLGSVLQVLVMVDKACGVSYTGLRIWPAAQFLAKLLAKSMMYVESDEGKDALLSGNKGYMSEWMPCRQKEIQEIPTRGLNHSTLSVSENMRQLRQLVKELRSLLKKKSRVLELGAGCGLVSAVAARAEADVTATDCFEDVLKRLEETAALNTPSFKVRRVQWGCEEHEPDKPDEPVSNMACELRKNSKDSEDLYDLILGADITYDCNPETVRSLLDLISSFAHDNSLILLVHGLRNYEKAVNLWSMVKERWDSAHMEPNLSNIQGINAENKLPDMSDCDEFLDFQPADTPVILFSFRGKAKQLKTLEWDCTRLWDIEILEIKHAICRMWMSMSGSWRTVVAKDPRCESCKTSWRVFRRCVCFQAKQDTNPSMGLRDTCKVLCKIL